MCICVHACAHTGRLGDIFAITPVEPSSIHYWPKSSKLGYTGRPASCENSFVSSSLVLGLQTYIATAMHFPVGSRDQIQGHMLVKPFPYTLSFILSLLSTVCVCFFVSVCVVYTMFGMCYICVLHAVTYAGRCSCPCVCRNQRRTFLETGCLTSSSSFW